MNAQPDNMVYRPCEGFEELQACVQLQIEVWGYGELDVVPRKLFIVSQRIGGQVIGAFDVSLGGGERGHADSMVGFAMALPAFAESGPYLHSHMLAVKPEYRDRGVGRRLKLLQRQEALSRGIERMEWTFDPLEIKNSFLNIARLGAVVRRYAPNFYGVTSSPLHGSIPTDRLYAEWRLNSDRVLALMQGKQTRVDAVVQQIVIPHQVAQWRHSESDQDRILEVQNRTREQFCSAFARDLAVVHFRVDAEGNGIFELGSWQELSASLRPALSALHREA